MIFGQLAGAAMLFMKIHADARKSLSDFWSSPLLQQPIIILLLFTNVIPSVNWQSTSYPKKD